MSKQDDPLTALDEVLEELTTEERVGFYYGMEFAKVMAQEIVGAFDKMIERMDRPIEQAEPDGSVTIRITVSDPDTGEVFETKDLTDDYLIICEGSAEETGVQAYANGTQVITVKNPRHNRRDSA